MLQRENGTATAEESVFLGSNPEVTRNDDFNSVFQYGNQTNCDTIHYRIGSGCHIETHYVSGDRLDGVSGSIPL
jgi:hypothetical protein